MKILIRTASGENQNFLATVEGSGSVASGQTAAEAIGTLVSLNPGQFGIEKFIHLTPQDWDRRTRLKDYENY